MDDQDYENNDEELGRRVFAAVYSIQAGEALATTYQRSKKAGKKIGPYWIDAGKEMLTRCESRLLGGVFLKPEEGREPPPATPGPAPSALEADVTIGGERLTDAQALTLRVAVGIFKVFCAEASNRGELSEPLATVHGQSLQEIEQLVSKSIKAKGAG